MFTGILIVPVLPVSVLSALNTSVVPVVPLFWMVTVIPLGIPVIPMFAGASMPVMMPSESVVAVTPSMSQIKVLALS